MRMKISLGLFCISTVLVVALSQTARGEEPQTQPDATAAHVIPAAGANRPPESTLPADINPNRAFAELARLFQAGVEPGVILAYIDNTLRLFELDADDIIYLTDLGAPAEVITAAMEHDRQLIEKGIPPEAGTQDAPPTGEVAEAIEDPPAEEVTVSYFYDTLAPYGVWVDIDGYGRCWRPSVAVYNTGWQPYCDNGHWVYTDYGWYWVSGYSWGRATFHYGRWFRHSHHGWCWWPDTYWAPSWVCWRYDRSYCGWAPLPPHAVYRPGVGFVYRGSSVAVGFSFGLDAGAFTFVATRDFCDRNPDRHRIDSREVARIYDGTTAFHEIKYDRNNRRISNSGIPPRNITAATRQEIRPVSIQHVQRDVTKDRQHDRFDRNGHAQTVNRPSRVTPQEATPATLRNNPQRPEHSSGLSMASNEGQSYSRKSGEINNPERNASPSSPSSPPARQKQAPVVTPRQQEHKNGITPPGNDSNSPVRKQEQKKNSSEASLRSDQLPGHVNNPSPPAPPKEKGGARGKAPDQREHKAPQAQDH